MFNFVVIGGVTYCTGGAGLSAFMLSRAAVAGTSMGLDDELRRRIVDEDYAGAWDQAQQHFPLWGTARGATRAIQKRDYIDAGFNVATFLVDVAGFWRFRPKWKVSITTKQVAGKKHIKQGTTAVQQSSKSLKIPGSGEWKSTKWNIGEAAVNKKHHNWHKIFGDKKPTLKEIDPYVKEALTKGQWRKIGILRDNTRKTIGDKIELVQEVKGHKIWLLGKLDSTGEIICSSQYLI